MAEDLRTPRFTDQIVMQEDAAMGMKICAERERNNKMFVAEPNQLRQVAGLCSCGS